MTSARQLFLHNTLSNQRMLFAPLDAAHVRLYVCGPTVYGPVHVGNARPAVVFDLLFRLLRRGYPQVSYARNITDIDDKIIAAAAQTGESVGALTDKWRQAYQRDIARLNALPPTFEPLATDSIAAIIALIQKLIARGNAYAAQAHVLFHVPSFADYGALSNRRREDMIAGARVEVAPYKRDAADFVLWKPSSAQQPGWDSPWGRGRPGWHIECSAMAAQCLGEQIDIHGGGQDLIFPHHENELAQSRCAHAAPRFANFWLHNGHVQMQGEKMSKSQGNVLSLQDALARYHGETVRLALLTAHYRQPLNWTTALLDEAKATLDKWQRALADGAAEGDAASAEATDADLAPEVEAALHDDLNTPAAIAAMHALARRPAALRAGGNLLGILQCSPQEWFQGAAAPDAAAIQKQIEARLQAKREKNFAAADQIRTELAAQGIILEDGADGTTWRRK